jgi:dipeptidyl aminopeptidase/acylaminoacyl peptidase
MTRILVAAALVGALGGAAAAAVLPHVNLRATRVVVIHYVAHDGLTRAAFLLLPRWYTPKRDPPLPLVISPHGRGVNARANARVWGDLPGRDGFAVLNPEGQGRKLELYSWGDPGQISDLARMPTLLERALPWLHVDPRRIYAVGSSMGGQETLLLVARFPRLLAGAISFDAPTNFTSRYGEFAELRHGARLQRLARYEVGGTPSRHPGEWAVRSPLEFARGIARSGVPLAIWWSVADRVITGERGQSGLLYREIERLNPKAPVVQVVGRWRHGHEMRSTSGLPRALAWLGLD